MVCGSTACIEEEEGGGGGGGGGGCVPKALQNNNAHVSYAKISATIIIVTREGVGCSR